MNAQRWSRPALLVLLLVGVLALNHAALADGKVFSRAVAAVNIPDQEALIHFADGVETLVIETRFEPPASKSPEPGAAGSVEPDRAAFAWVVPVPGPRAASGGGGGGGGSVPEVFATTSGVFPTLRAVCAPRVTHNVGPGYLVFGTIAGLILLAAVASGSVWMRLFVVLVLLVFLAMVFLPSLGKARSSARGLGSGVEVYSRQVIGSFDVAVVGAASASAASEVRAWLAAEGFHVPSEAAGVMEEYAARGWVFIAAKLMESDPEAGSKLTPHPLAVRFKAAAPVYPMRLTAVGNRELSLDLYVFADRLAAVEGMETVRCGPVVRSGPAADDRRASFEARENGGVVVGHRALLELTGSAATVTKLSGVFTPAQMGRDLVVTWDEPRVVGDHKYSRQGASILAMNVAGAAWLAAVVGVFVVGAVRKVADRRLARLGLAALAPCLLIGLGVRAALPTTEVTVERGRPRPYLTAHMLTMAAEAVERSGEGAGSLEAFRVAMRSEVERLTAPSGVYHRVASPPHEDSPGGYVVRGASDGRFEVVYFDELGREEVVWGPGAGG